MQCSRRLSPGIVVSCLLGMICLAFGGVCRPCPFLISVPTADDSVCTRMVAAATAEIRKTHAAAQICWAGGRREDGTELQMPAETNVWDFLAIALTPQGVQGWYMTYNRTWTTVDLESDPLGLEFLDLTQVTMDVVEAWTLAQAAGFGPFFRSWELLKPLNPNVANIIYVFNMPDGSYVIVDTVTGTVTQERDAWGCYTRCREQYISCCDWCRENWPGDPECYDGCDQSRYECDQGCE
ncbi:MAG: hypothetical protein KA354_24225 [Phycisphaerae bacterium]|nr:hypothetical protein [Phycisphaerae bacterium]